jgi:hypothetical protein
MRLFEVDQGSARDVLAVLQGLANKEGQSAELPFPTVMKILQPFSLGISTPDGLIALKNAVDPEGDVIQDISDDGTVVLKTNEPSPLDQQQAPGRKDGPSVDRMAASGAKKLSPDL